MHPRFAWWLFAVLAVLTSACSDSSPPNAQPDDATDGATSAPVNTGNPGTLLPPTTTTEALPIALPIEPTVAFLDACVATVDLVGPCHCAGERLQHSFSAGELVIFEDRLSGRNEFSPEVAAALVDCRDAARPAAWSEATVEAYVLGCTQGSSRLADLCRCSALRAADIVPEARVDEYLASDHVQPSLVALINTCL